MPRPPSKHGLERKYKPWRKGKGKHPSSSSSSSTTTTTTTTSKRRSRSLKNQLRGQRRLLTKLLNSNHPNTTKEGGGDGGTPTDGTEPNDTGLRRSTKESIRMVQQRIKDIEMGMEEKERVEREKKFAVKYHRIKFIERQKLTRRYKQSLRQLNESKLACDHEAIQTHLTQLRSIALDQLYVAYYPTTKKYMALFGNDGERIVDDDDDDGMDEKGRKRREEVRREVWEVVTKGDDASGVGGGKRILPTKSWVDTEGFLDLTLGWEEMKAVVAGGRNRNETAVGGTDGGEGNNSDGSSSVPSSDSENKEEKEQQQQQPQPQTGVDPRFVLEAKPPFPPLQPSSSSSESKGTTKDGSTVSQQQQPRSYPNGSNSNGDDDDNDSSASSSNNGSDYDDDDECDPISEAKRNRTHSIATTEDNGEKAGDVSTDKDAVDPNKGRGKSHTDDPSDSSSSSDSDSSDSDSSDSDSSESNNDNDDTNTTNTAIDQTHTALPPIPPTSFSKSVPPTSDSEDDDFFLNDDDNDNGNNPNENEAFASATNATTSNDNNDIYYGGETKRKWCHNGSGRGGDKSKGWQTQRQRPGEWKRPRRRV